MSVLLFLDESRHQLKGNSNYFATTAGVAFEEAQYNVFCRKFFQLKGKFFKKEGIGEFVLRGRRMLNRRALESPRKVEFIHELFSLCRLHKAVTFASTRLFQPEEDQLPAEFAQWLPAGSIALTDQSRKGRCSILLAYVLERLNSFILETYPEQNAQLIRAAASTASDSEFSAILMDFFYRTPYGPGFRGILGTPLFAPAPYSPGLQVADLFAYIINQHHAGRKEMKDFFDEVESMQFVSAFQQDDFELKGLNLLS